MKRNVDPRQRHISLERPRIEVERRSGVPTQGSLPGTPSLAQIVAATFESEP